VGLGGASTELVALPDRVVCIHIRRRVRGERARARPEGVWRPLFDPHTSGVHMAPRAARQPARARAPAAGARLRYHWGAVALVLSGLALSNGTVRDGRGAGVGTPAFANFARAGARGDASAGQWPRLASQAGPLRRLRVPASLSLRRSMSDTPVDGAAGETEEDKLLWSRRLNRAYLTLGKDPDAWGSGVAAAEDRLLWSRRLARAVSALLTDPDLVPLDRLWSGGGGRQGSNLRSALGMLQEAEDDCVLGDEEGAEEAGAGAGAGARARAVAKVEQACPFRPKLPALTPAEERALLNGERVQRQTRNGRVGTGLVVVDVDADVSTAFAVLTDIDRYPERIPTVRAAVTYHRAEKLLKTQFQISKFRLQINTELRCAREANMLEFKMDPERPAPFLDDASGFWFLEVVGRVVADGDAAASESSPRTRIWLVADLACSALLPTAIVDYAAARALPRATSWLQPVMKEAAGQLPPIPVKQSTQEQKVTGGV